MNCWAHLACFSHLLQLLLVLVPMTLPHVSLFSFGVTEGDKALEALQTLMLICVTVRRVVQ